MDSRQSVPIPAFVNPASGSVELARAALRADQRFEVREIHPQDIADAVRTEVKERDRSMMSYRPSGYRPSVS
jgi:23S rRNA A2030 N6-methylase RlmJ